VHVLRKHRGARRVESSDPRGPGDLLGSKALGQVVPGDLGSKGIEASAALVRDLVQGRHRLVAASVAAADGAQHGVVCDHRAARVPVVAYPVESRHVVDDGLDVLGLLRRVLDVRLAPAVAVPALVDAHDPEAGVEETVDLGRHAGRPAPAPPVRVEDDGGLRGRARAARLEDGDRYLGSVVRVLHGCVRDDGSWSLGRRRGGRGEHDRGEEDREGPEHGRRGSL
jgi:hypothetical protein